MLLWCIKGCQSFFYSLATTLQKIIWHQTLHPTQGGTQMARGGIRLVHGLTKSTLITYFSGMKIDPKYAFLHAFFLICLPCSFQNLSVWPKTYPFFPILHVFGPLKRCTVRAYSAWSWSNNPNYVNFWTSLIPPLTFEWHPRDTPVTHKWQSCVNAVVVHSAPILWILSHTDSLYPTEFTIFYPKFS